MGVQQYRVLAAANGRVNGEDHETGDLVYLTDAQARYELDMQRVEPTGAGFPAPDPAPLDPRVQASDLVLGLRGVLRNTISVAELESYLAGDGRAIPGLIALLRGILDAHVARADNPHAVTKAQIGLGNVTDTADANKPVSTAQSAADAAVRDAAASDATAKAGAAKAEAIAASLQRGANLADLADKAAARGALSAAKAGANGDISSLSGLTTALSIAQGGTGRTDGANLAPVSNFAAIGAPSAANGSSQGYSVGSRWLRPATGDEWVCRDATSGAARWVKTTGLRHPGYVAGRRYNGVSGNPSSLVVPGASISGVPAQRIWLYPDPIPQRIAVNQLGVWLYDNPDAAGAFMLGVYAADPVSKLPTGLPILAGANAGPTSAAGIPINLDLAAAVYQDVGLYWPAFMTSSATARFEGFLASTSPLTNLIGAINGGNPGAQSGAYAALAYGASYGAWPDLTGTTEASYVAVNGQYAPAIWSRVSAVG